MRSASRGLPGCWARPSPARPYDRSLGDRRQVLIIIADNEIPAAYVHQFEQEAFSPLRWTRYGKVATVDM